MVAPDTINEGQSPHGPVTTSSPRGSIMTYGSAPRRDVHADSIAALIGVVRIRGDDAPGLARGAVSQRLDIADFAMIRFRRHTQL